MSVDLNWRPMHGDDIDGVVAVARASFPDHFEDRACFEERLELYRQGCFVLASNEGVRGYLIAYPWPEGAIPPLNTALGGLPDTQDTFYLHDLALHPDMRGQGHARPIVDYVAARLKSAGVRRVALVSVNGTQSFWENLGFVPVSSDEALTRKLASYGADARYMVRAI